MAIPGQVLLFDQIVGVEKGSGLRFLPWKERALPAPPKSPDLSAPIFVVSAKASAPGNQALGPGAYI